MCGKRIRDSKGRPGSQPTIIAPTNIIHRSLRNSKRLPIVTISGDNRPHVQVSINGESFTGLLDSGAQSTVVGSPFYPYIKQLDLKVTSCSAVVKTADATEHVIQVAVDLPIQFNNIIRTISALYVPTMPKLMIAGMDFWQKFDIRPVVCETMESSKSDSTTGSHELTQQQSSLLADTLKSMPFSKDGKLSQTSVITHSIDTGKEKPIRQRQYIVSPYLQKDISTEIDRLLSLGVIYVCPGSEWNNPVVAVRKPSGKIRLCLDARKLNDVTVKDAYPAPQINRILAQLGNTKFLSAIDLSDAFLQVPLEADSRSKTAFSISGRGQFAYARMPFGLCNSAATLCRLVDKVIGCDLEPDVFVYLDDIIIATGSFERHLEVLAEIAKRLKGAGLTISPEKSKFCMRELRYLGYIVSVDGIRPDPEKVEAIVNYPIPKCVKDVRRLVGLAGWYRRFIGNFATITAPLTDLIKKKAGKIVWSEESRKSFDKLKEVLTSKPVLASPDYSQPFILQTDASDLGIGAVLLQGEGESERVVAYLSRKLTPQERKYQTTERECLAVIAAIEKFRPYIEGIRFTVITDHASLLWLQNLKNPAGRLGRWALRLQPYDFEIRHRKGKFMVVADALSRAVSVEAIDATSFTKSTDQWYADLKRRVEEAPQRYVQFRVENDILYKACARNSRQANSNWRVVVPQNFRREVLQDCHDSPLSAHGGFFKTIDRVRRLYYWPKMENEIRLYVKSCEICKASKQAIGCQTAPMGKQSEVEKPWQMIYIDFVGPLPRSRNGYTHLFVAVDAFSKFVRIQPMRNATSKGVVQYLKDHIFHTFGVPNVIVSDNGKQFTSEIFKKFLETYGVKLWLTSKYHPQANACEAANKTVGISIRSYIDGDHAHRDWDRYVSDIACAMNTSVHSSTRHTPYEINFGHNMITYGKIHEYGKIDKPNEAERNEKLETLRNRVKENLAKSYETRKNRYDLRSRTISYKEGEMVWRRNFILSDASKGFTSKLAPKYIKGRIKKALGTNSYQLVDINGKDVGVYSTQDLKKC